MVHDLKCHAKFYADVASGDKPFEVRKDDRDYKVGDVLHLREYEPSTQEYTGKSCKRDVTYILRDTAYVKEGYCIMGIRAHKEE